MTFWVSQSKDRAYVVNVVSWYRQELDRALADRGGRRTSSGSSRVDFEPDVTKTFNRGFSSYVVHGRGEPLGSIDSPKMVGEYVGRVDEIQDKTFTLETSLSLHSGDGLCWLDATGELQGSAVNATGLVESKTGKTRVTPNKMTGIRTGLRIHRNRDHHFLHQVERCRPNRKIAVRFRLESVANGFHLHAEDEDGNRVTGWLATEKEPALNPGRADASSRKQLAKTGDTPFVCTGVDLAWDQPYFLSVASLNALRRETLEHLSTERAANRPLMRGDIVPNSVPHPETALTYRGNVLNRKAEAFYRRHGVLEIEPAPESGLDMQGRVVMRSRYCLKHQLGLCDGTPRPSELREPLALVDEDGHQYPLHFDCAACEMKVSY